MIRLNQNTLITGDLEVTGTIFGAGSIGGGGVTDLTDTIILDPVVDSRNVIAGDISARIVLASRITGDTQNRFQIDGSGKATWGTGSATPDASLYRTVTSGQVSLHSNRRIESEKYVLAFIGQTGQVYMGDWTGTSLADGAIVLGVSEDTNIYRSAANVLKTDDQFVAADGVRTKTTAGATTDGAFTVTPADGHLAVDTTNNAVYFRSGGIWRNVAAAADISGAVALSVSTDARNVIVTDTSARLALVTKVTGDTQNRFAFDTTGKLVWGTGAATPDTNLYRSATNNLKTDGALTVVGLISSDGIIYASNTVTNNKTAIGGGAITFGPDTALYRNGVGVLQTDNTFVAGSNFNVLGTFTNLPTGGVLNFGSDTSISRLRAGTIQIGASTAAQRGIRLVSAAYGFTWEQPGDVEYSRIRSDDTLSNEIIRFRRNSGLGGIDLLGTTPFATNSKMSGDIGVPGAFGNQKFRRFFQFSASNIDHKRLSLFWMSRDTANWAGGGGFEIIIRTSYYGGGSHTRTYIGGYAYNNDYSIKVLEGSGTQQIIPKVGTDSTVSGTIHKREVYVEIPQYVQCEIEVVWSALTPTTQPFTSGGQLEWAGTETVLGSDPGYYTFVTPTGNFNPLKYVNVRDYGAVGNGATNDAAAIDAARAACGAGYTLWFPAGNYIYATNIGTGIGLNFDDTSSITMLGEGGNYPSPATTLTFTGTCSATGEAISFASSTGFRIRDMAIRYTNAGFVGILLGGDKHTPNASFGDTTLPVIENATFGGNGVSGAAALLTLGGAILVEVDNCNLFNAAVGVRGRRNVDDYSNVINFKNCLFSGTIVGNKNASSQWKWDGCTFEVNKAYDFDAGLDQYTNAYASTAPSGVEFIGCWFGDGGSASLPTNWIRFAGRGLVVEGCEIQNGDKCIEIVGMTAPSGGTLDPGPTRGITIKGNDFWFFNRAIVFSGLVKDYDISPNSYENPQITKYVDISAHSSNYTTSLPTSPWDGQEIILVDSLTNPSYHWTMRYNANSSSAYKWEFIGGQQAWRAVHLEVGSSFNSATYVDVSLGGIVPSFTLPFAGDWTFGWGGAAYNSTGSYIYASLYLGATPSDDNSVRMDGGNIGNYWREMAVASLAAGTVIKMQFKGSGSCSVFDQTLMITPRHLG